MKKLLLLFTIIGTITHANASDTLTVRQVFNFNVGDTFDYKISHNEYTSMTGIERHNYGFSRTVILQKYTSPANDTFTYIRQIYPETFVSLTSAYFDTITYTDLDSSVIFKDSSLFNTMPLNFYKDTAWGARERNHIQTMGLGCGYTREYVAGLGYSDRYNGCSDGTGNEYLNNDTLLIYYANPSGSIGTPAYIADGRAHMHYIPLPETCAVWNMRSIGPPPANDTLYEQIRTHNTQSSNNLNYVEMLYRSYNTYTHAYTPDSLIGYFANDTARKLVWFTQSLNSLGTIMYDFSVDNGDANCTGYVTLADDTIGGIIRTHYSTVYPCTYNRLYFLDYLSGIGGTAGLINVKQSVNFPFYISSLTSLCVCGRILYPDTATTSQCGLLAGISDIFSDAASISLYPNPATAELHLSLPDMITGKANLTLTDLLGQEVYSSGISAKETTHDISELPVGIYTWRINTNGGIIKTGKVVKD